MVVPAATILALARLVLELCVIAWTRRFPTDPLHRSTLSETIMLLYQATVVLQSLSNICALTQFVDPSLIWMGNFLLDSHRISSILSSNLWSAILP